MFHAESDLSPGALPPPAEPSASAARYVQVFSDLSVEDGQEGGLRATGWLPLTAAATAPMTAGLARAGLLALLHRLTHQERLALDTYLDRGTAPRGVDVTVDGNAPFRALVDDPSSADQGVVLPQVSSPSPTSVAVANIAMTWWGKTTTVSGLAEPVLACPATDPVRDLHWVFAQTATGTQFALVYNGQRFSPMAIEQFVTSYSVLLRHAVQHAECRIADLPLLDPQGLKALAETLEGGTADYPPVPVLQRFAAQVRCAPAALAGTFEQQQLRYGELDQRSSQLAHTLLAHGAGRGIPVAVCVRPSLDMLVALLAIWKAGAVYLPLDPTHPPALIARMIDEAKPLLLLTTVDLVTLAAATPTVLLDQLPTTPSGVPVPLPAVAPALDDPAYLFYTSGTTGRPKGVQATHRNLVQYIASAGAKYGFRPSDVFTSLARYTFSISLFDLVVPLCFGASVRLIARDDLLSLERLGSLLESVTVVHAGPSLLGTLIRHLDAASAGPRTLSNLRHVSTGGDLVPPAVMAGMVRVFPQAELFVIYGCTEISCMGTTFAIPRHAPPGRCLIGRPFPNVVLRLIDDHGHPVPYGVTGEICVSSPGVVPGYLHRPELTAEKFVDLAGCRFYRTGDVGRLHIDGNLEMLGRRDFQVQLRGIRIELGGIERVMQELGLAAQCAVVAKPVAENDVRLVAYVVRPSDPEIASVRRTLGRELPDYMLPQHLVTLDAMPLTVNGKLDRGALIAMPWVNPAQTAGAVADEVTTPHEQAIAAAFARVLGLSAVAVHANFFELGGDSLRGVVLLEDIRRTTGCDIPARVLFETGTVAGLASHLVQGDPVRPRPILLNRPVSGSPLFMLSGVHIYRSLAAALDGQCSAYGVFAAQELSAFDPGSGPQSVQSLARDYLEIILAQQPQGPYRLLGYSFAGFIAYEVAQQLRARGDVVSALILVDTYHPEWLRPWRFRLAQARRLFTTSPRDLLAFVRQRWHGASEQVELSGVHQQDAELAPLERRRTTTNLAAAGDYMRHCPSFDGAALLVVSSVRLRQDPMKSRNGGWAAFIPALEVRIVEAHHLHMLTDASSVQEIAAMVAARQ